MNYDKEFEKIYEIIADNNSEELDFGIKQIKKERFKNIVLMIALVIVGIPLYSLVYKIVYPYDEFTFLFVLIYLLFIVFFNVKGMLTANDYIFSLNKTILKVLFEYFKKSFEYFPDNGIRSDLYDDAEFEKYTGYYTSNLIHCKFEDDCNLSIAQVDTYYHRSRLFDKTLFSGMVAKIEIPKSFNVDLYLKKEEVDSIFGFINVPDDTEKVEIDLSAFNVYCSKPNIVNELLTEDIINLLIEFKKEINNEYEVTIKNNLVYIRFMCGELFDLINTTKKSVEKIKLYKYYKILDFIFKLTDKLIKLNISTEHEE